MDNKTTETLLNETLKRVSEHKDFKKITEALCSNIIDINNIETSKNTEENTNLLNMYLLDEQGNNICDILNKINDNLSKIVNTVCKT